MLKNKSEQSNSGKCVPVGDWFLPLFFKIKGIWWATWQYLFFQRYKYIWLANEQTKMLLIMICFRIHQSIISETTPHQRNLWSVSSIISFNSNCLHSIPALSWLSLPLISNSVINPEKHTFSSYSYCGFEKNKSSICSSRGKTNKCKLILKINW